MGFNRALLVLVTSSGAVTSRMYSFSVTLTGELIGRFLSVAEENLIGKEWEGIVLILRLARIGLFGLRY